MKSNKTLFYILILVLLPYNSFAADDLSDATDRVHQIFYKVQSELHATSPKKECDIIERISLKIEESPNPMFAAAVRKNNLVVISTGFLSGLYNFIRSAEIEKRTGIPDFTEQAIFEYKHIFLYEKPFFDAYELAGINSKKFRSEIDRAVNMSFDASLIPIFAHEIGHHVTNGFYDYDTPNYKKKKIEKAADEWSINAMRRSRIPNLGAIFPLSYIYFWDLTKIDSEGDVSHDAPMYRLSISVEDTIDNIENLIQYMPSSDNLVGELERVLKLIGKMQYEDKNKDEDFYYERAGKYTDKFDRIYKKHGYKSMTLLRFASADYYRSGLLYLRGPLELRDPEKGFRHMVLASITGYPPANSYIGFLYGNGIGTDRDVTKAKKHYRVAAKQGYIEAKKRLVGF